MTTIQSVIQFILFQTTWLTAALGFVWFGTDIWSIVPLMLLAGTLVWSSVAYPKKTIIAIAVIVGITMDACLSHLGIYDFPQDRKALPFIDLPYWLVIMWVGFSMTLIGSTLWLLNRSISFVIFSGIFGPLSYWMGMNLGIIEFQLQWLPLLVTLWCAWGCMVVWSWGVLGRAEKGVFA